MLVGGIAVVAALVGIVLGFVLRGVSARSERAQHEAKSAEQARDLVAIRADLARAQADAAARAGFEAVAAERARNIEQLNAERESLRAETQAKNEVERALSSRVKELEAELRNERQNMAERLALLESAKQILADQFQALAGQVLDAKAKAFSESSQTQLGSLLAPLREQIDGFRKKVEEAQSDSKTGVTKLETLIGALHGMNQQLAEEARNLTTALRGSAKTQGDWGEFILRDLLEKAGLREGEQYSFQQTFTGLENENGGKAQSVRTDVVLRMPGERSLVIDSKVSLTAYTDYVSAETDIDRAAALKQHLASVRGHIAGLSKAGYHRLPGVEAPDFVVMFVPVEPAFLMALQNDAALWADAYRQGILLVGPTTLLYIIRIVNVLWDQDKQVRNVMEVMDRGAKLYEKFVGFVSDLEEIGKSLRKANASYAGAAKKLTEGGGLIRQVEMLRELGVKPRKTLTAKLLEGAEAEEPNLALAAEADLES